MTVEASMEDRPQGLGDTRNHENGHGHFTRCVLSRSIIWAAWGLGGRWLWSCQKGGFELQPANYLTKKEKLKLFIEKGTLEVVISRSFY